MLPTVWFRRNEKFDMSWLEEALVSIEDNTLMTPVYILGAGWPDADREAAALTLIRALATNRSVSALVLKDAIINTEKHQALAETLGENVTLERVAFRNLSNENGHRYSVPATLFDSPSLRSICLHRCYLDTEACRSLAKVIREGGSLTNLSLDDVEFDSMGCTWVLAALCWARGLTSLTVRNLTWNTEQVRRFVMVLALNRSVESLSIERMTSPSLPRHLAYMVSRNRHLRTFSIRQNDIDARGLSILCREGFRNNSHIQTIMLSRNPLGAEGAQIVMDLLKDTPNITSVCLALTNLGRDGCRTVAKLLPECLHIRRINLGGNHVEDCADVFLESVTRSYSIVSLFDGLPKLLSTRDCPFAWKKVDVLLRANQAKRGFFRNATEHPDAVVPLLLQSASTQPDVLFHFLQQLGRPLKTTNRSTMNASQFA